jgi:hypothetical protein
MLSLPVTFAACAFTGHFDLVHIIAGASGTWFSVILAGSAFVILVNHYANRDLVIRAAAGRRDIEHGTVVVYSGPVRRAWFAEDVREPQLCDLSIQFEDGHEIFAATNDIRRFGLVAPPSEWAKLVRLPNSQIVISFEWR